MLRLILSNEKFLQTMFLILFTQNINFVCKFLVNTLQVPILHLERRIFAQSIRQRIPKWRSFKVEIYLPTAAAADWHLKKSPPIHTFAHETDRRAHRSSIGKFDIDWRKRTRGSATKEKCSFWGHRAPQRHAWIKIWIALLCINSWRVFTRLKVNDTETGWALRVRVRRSGAADASQNTRIKFGWKFSQF